MGDLPHWLNICASTRECCKWINGGSYGVTRVLAINNHRSCSLPARQQQQLETLELITEPAADPGKAWRGEANDGERRTKLTILWADCDDVADFTLHLPHDCRCERERGRERDTKQRLGAAEEEEKVETRAAIAAARHCLTRVRLLLPILHTWVHLFICLYVNLHTCVCVWANMCECHFSILRFQFVYCTARRTDKWLQAGDAAALDQKGERPLRRCGDGGRGRASEHGLPGMPDSCSWLTYYDHLIARFNLPSFFFCAALRLLLSQLLPPPEKGKPSFKPMG